MSDQAITALYQESEILFEMASPADDLKDSFGKLIIDPIEVTGEALGKGSYGQVFVVKYKGLRCAGKLFYASVFDVDGENGSSLVQQFSRDCVRAYRIRHPNILQLYGVHFGHATTPTILTELLPLTLSRVLEDYTQIPKHAKLSILLDVATGLHHLHQQDPPIIHGHLSASKVLLTRGLQAKVMMTFTTKTSTHADESVQGDVFSFGDLIIQVSLQKWPILLEDREVETPPQNGSISEIQRREKFLARMGEDDLQALARKCLQDDPHSRPPMTEIIRALESMAARSQPPYTNTLEMLTTINELSLVKDDLSALNKAIEAKEEGLEAWKQQNEALRQELEARDEQLRTRNDEIQSMKQAVQAKDRVTQAYEQALRAKDALMKAKDFELQAKKKELAAKDALLKTANRRIEILEQTPTRRRTSSFSRSRSVDRDELPDQQDAKLYPYVADDSDMVVKRKVRGRRHKTTVISDGLMQYPNPPRRGSQELDPKLASLLARQHQRIEENQPVEAIQELELTHEQKDEDGPLSPHRKPKPTGPTPELQRLLEKRRSHIELSVDDQ